MKISSLAFENVTKYKSIYVRAIFLIAGIIAITVLYGVSPLAFSIEAWLVLIVWLIWLTQSGNTTPHYITWVAGTLPVIFLWVLYGDALHNWFMADDPYHVQHILKHGILTSFIDPAKGMWPYHYTPLLTTSFGIDVLLFGMEPRFYYIHHLLTFSLTLVLLYSLFIRFLPPLISSLVLIIFVASACALVAAHLLMLRHYIEGLGLSAAALLCFVSGMERRSWRWHILGAALYFAAALAKELYVPLVGVLLVLPVGGWRSRLAYMPPYIGVALLYIVLRWHMLGAAHFFRSYPGLHTDVEDIIHLPLNYATFMYWPAMHWAILIAGLFVFLIYGMRDFRAFSIFILIWMTALLIPIFPILSIMNINSFLLIGHPRFVFVLTLAIYFSVGFGLYRLVRRYEIVGGALFLLLLSNLHALHSMQDSVKLEELEKIYSVQGQFMLKSENAKGVLISPLWKDFFYYPVIRSEFGLPQGPVVVENICEAVAQYPERDTYYKYSIDLSYFNPGQTPPILMGQLLQFTPDLSQCIQHD